MWLQATFTRDDLARALDELTPALLDLGQGRELTLEKPTVVELVEAVGLRIRCAATLRWDVLGITVPIGIRAVQVFLKPQIGERDGSQGLRLLVELEEGDVHVFPSIIDHAIVGRLNKGLAEADMFWDFTRTLDFDIPMPKVVRSADRLKLFSQWGDLKITSEGFTMAASFRADFHAPVKSVPLREPVAAVATPTEPGAPPGPPQPPVEEPGETPPPIGEPPEELPQEKPPVEEPQQQPPAEEPPQAPPLEDPQRDDPPAKDPQIEEPQRDPPAEVPPRESRKAALDTNVDLATEATRLRVNRV